MSLVDVEVTAGDVRLVATVAAAHEAHARWLLERVLAPLARAGGPPAPDMTPAEVDPQGLPGAGQRGEPAASPLRERGPGLRDGTTLRVGWTLLTLRARDDGALQALEPDFSALHLAGARRADITTSLEVLARQGAVLERTGAEAEDAPWSHHFVAAPGALTAARVCLRRDAPDGPTDSGWRLFPLEGEAPDDPGAYRMFPVAHLVATRPALLSALALPRGWMAVFDGDALTGVADADDQERWAPPA